MIASISSRFAITVSANIVRSTLSFTTGMLLARWLGPASYGDMAFLIGTFVGIRQLLEMGTSSAFFTFMSQKRRSRRFVGFFYFWLAVQFSIAVCVIGVLFPSSWINSVWHGEERGLVLLAFAAVFTQGSVWSIVQQAGESQRRTLWVQGIGATTAAVHLLAVFLLWWLGLLGLYAIFAAIFLEYLLASIVAHKDFVYASRDETDVGDNGPLLVSRKFLGYCLPLIPYCWVAFAYEFADRWLLQNYGGSVEQAYYAVGAQIAAISLIATTSILSIFWKEIAESHHQGNHARTGFLYQKVSRLLFLVGAIIAGYFIPWSAVLLERILGSNYAGGATTLAIMFLYPIHQSMGQIGGTMLVATERVALQVISGIVFMGASMCVTYFVLAPRDGIFPGLGLGSEGLAIKMVVMQLVQVNIVAYCIARIWCWPFDWIYQPVSLLGCVGLGWVAHFLVARVIGQNLTFPLDMGLAGIVYAILILAFIYCMGWLCGLSRQELLHGMSKVRTGAIRMWKIRHT